MYAATTENTVSTSKEVTSLSYLEQDCPLTLREGFGQFMKSAPGLIPSDESTEVGSLTKAHDCCHVLFGLTTSIRDELLADTWTLVGSTVTIREYMRFLQHDEYKELAADLTSGANLIELIKNLPVAFKAIVRGRRMSQKWPFFDYAQYLDTPLVELRRHYNVELIPRPS